MAPLPGEPASLSIFAWLGLGSSVLCVGAAILQLIRRGFLLPQRELEREVRATARFALQRPAPVQRAAVRELRILQLRFDELRRSFLGALRSSTEQNLELDAEVARRSAELLRRNEELTEALSRLARTRDELVATEQLATVGQIASKLTSAIAAPIEKLLAESAKLDAGLTELRAVPLQNAADPAAQSAQAAHISMLITRLTAIEESCDRASAVIEAVRVYARPVGAAKTGILTDPPPLAIREALAGGDKAAATGAGR